MITIKVLARNGEPPADPIQATFDEHGGTIGRAPNNTLVLADADRYIARIQASIQTRHRRYFIRNCGHAIDITINKEKIAPGNEAPLSPGDVIGMGSYTLQVSAGASDANDKRRAEQSTADPMDAFDLTEHRVDTTPAAFDDELLRTADHFDAFADAFFDPRKEDVKLGAAAPDSVSPGEQFVAHVFAYPAGQENEARKIIESQNPGVIPRLGKRTCRWARGTSIKVCLRALYVEIEHPELSFDWNGAFESLDFSIKVSNDAPAGNVVLNYDVTVDDFLVAALCLTLRISVQPTRAKPVTATAYAARTAFASYASEDRPLVTHMVGAIEQSAGIAVFQDCLDLKASEEWKPRLAAEILTRELFFLFWSRSASQSQWVEWEWKTALRDKGKEAMQIYPLQADVRPPAALSALHCSGVHVIVADYYSRQSRNGAGSPP